MSRGFGALQWDILNTLEKRENQGKRLTVADLARQLRGPNASRAEKVSIRRAVRSLQKDGVATGYIYVRPRGGGLELACWLVDPPPDDRRRVVQRVQGSQIELSLLNAVAEASRPEGARLSYRWVVGVLHGRRKPRGWRRYDRDWVRGDVPYGWLRERVAEQFGAITRQPRGRVPEVEPWLTIAFDRQLKRLIAANVLEPLWPEPDLTHPVAIRQILPLSGVRTCDLAQ
jgi:hypothetical protein